VIARDAERAGMRTLAVDGRRSVDTTVAEVAALFDCVSGRDRGAARGDDQWREVTRERKRCLTVLARVVA
jgi:hypothetical protein